VVTSDQVPGSLDLSENLSSDLAAAAAELNGTTVHVPRAQETAAAARRNRSCRVTTPHDTTAGQHSRSHSRHRYNHVAAAAARPTHRDRSSFHSV